MKKDNIIFVVVVVSFFLLLVFLKMGYRNMQEKEMDNLSETRWYVYEENFVKNYGTLEWEFKSDGSFNVYKADTQVSCMSGKYTVLLNGRVKLKCDSSGFNPPKTWNCKKKSTFKYKIKDDKLDLTYKGKTCTFERQGEKKVVVNSSDKNTLNNKFFINKSKKMLVTFYSGDMYLYTVNDMNNIFGSRGEVEGDICLFGIYEADKTNITVTVENEGDAASNSIWSNMTKVGEYNFKYSLSNNILKLEYDGKSCEFTYFEKK